MELKTTSFKQKRGIDDLKGLFAYRGNSQGDTSASNELGSDKMAGGWMSFVFDCKETQEAIDAEVKKRKEWNENYIEELKRENRFGEEYDFKISFVPHPLFDDPESERLITMTSSFFIFDTNKDEQEKKD